MTMIYEIPHNYPLSRMIQGEFPFARGKLQNIWPLIDAWVQRKLKTG